MREQLGAAGLSDEIWAALDRVVGSCGASSTAFRAALAVFAEALVGRVDCKMVRPRCLWGGSGACRLERSKACAQEATGCTSVPHTASAPAFLAAQLTVRRRTVPATRSLSLSLTHRPFLTVALSGHFHGCDPRRGRRAWGPMGSTPPHAMHDAWIVVRIRARNVFFGAKRPSLARDTLNSATRRI